VGEKQSRSFQLCFNSAKICVDDLVVHAGISRISRLRLDGRAGIVGSDPIFADRFVMIQSTVRTVKYALRAFPRRPGVCCWALKRLSGNQSRKAISRRNRLWHRSRSQTSETLPE
jgi:hypothetical protein